MGKFKVRVNRVIDKIKENNLREEELSHLNDIINSKLNIKVPKKVKIALFIFIIAFLWNKVSDYINTDECYVAMPDVVSRAFRPIQSCDFCNTVYSIDSVSNITPDEFEEKYAYSGRPVIIKDAQVNWTASEVFSFNFFKDLYLNSYGTRRNCQFFRYKTEFKTLKEALNMDEERAAYRSGDPWYFGWSNCDYEIADDLRQHYSRPYFLPRLSENHHTDWIFMGGTGLGAHMHVDNVRYPSWQAQIRGNKVWTLAPPPECYFQCRWFTVTVNKGDTIVLDTNKWFHKTEVLPGEISITIGAEYD